MSASDFDYIATRNEIIEGAFRIVGVLEDDGVLTGEQLQQGLKALQLIVKDWSNQHLFLWSYNLSTFSSVAAQEAYTSTLEQAIIGIDKAWIVDSNEDIPLEVITWSGYRDIIDKETNAGRPCAIAFKPTPAPTVYLWPSPDAIYTIKLLALYPLQDMDSASGSGDIPVRFQRALKYQLASDLFDEYPGPMNERQLIMGKAAQLFQAAKNFDVPLATNNEVEGFYGRGRY